MLWVVPIPLCLQDTESNDVGPDNAFTCDQKHYKKNFQEYGIILEKGDGYKRGGKNFQQPDGIKAVPSDTNTNHFRM
jgi:hypothetical protein